MSQPYQPVYEVTRGRIVESIHFGAAAIVDSRGRLLAHLGDPQAVTFLRSTAKPFQALPFIERGGREKFGLAQREIAILCASHTGTAEHVETVKQIQAKIGISVDDLLCGTHYPLDESTTDQMKRRGELPNAYCHNCSGKHTGMLAHAKMRHLALPTYLEFDHPIQVFTLQVFAELCDLPQTDVELGIDGCSAPNFAVPLFHAALGYARLCDPFGLPTERAAACQTITSAMTAHPNMVGGPGRFDTRLMEATQGRIVAKGGAEGYQGIGLLPGALGPDSPGIGIAIKISDGDPSGRALHGVSLSILQALGALSTDEMTLLADFGPANPLYNFRKLAVGERHPAFKLEYQ